MIECPFEVVSCSWPRPAVQENEGWISEPEWDAPLMPTYPEPHVELLQDDWYWAFNWTTFFQSDLLPTAMWGKTLMRNFHVIFKIKINYDGVLVINDDRCIVRRGESIIHCNRKIKKETGVEIEVNEGEVIEIAQWNSPEVWVWGAYLRQLHGDDLMISTQLVDIFTPYLALVQQRLQSPDGPPLKIYTNAKGPIRTLVAIYSMLLNGYVPSAVYIYEDHWSEQARNILEKLLPFAQIISTTQVLSQLRPLFGGRKLVQFATKKWFAMKMCIALLCPPHEFCLMDDDVFILDRLDDAVEAFKTHDFVYTTQEDWGRLYMRKWRSGWSRIFRKRSSILSTGTFNGGLYWLRNTKDQKGLVVRMLKRSPLKTGPAMWEQGFIAVTYADVRQHGLPSQRYFLPITEGFPGGVYGYDYAQNPCGFASIHFAGTDKPADGLVLHLMPSILQEKWVGASHLAHSGS